MTSPYLQSLSDFPQTDYSGVPRSNTAGTLWGQAPHIHGIDCHVGGTLPPTSKYITGTVSAFDAAVAVGFVIDDVTYSVLGASDAPTFVALWNAKATHRAIGLASVPSAGVIGLTIEGLSDPTITSYTPGAPDITGITTVTSGSAPKYVAAGTAVVKDYSASEFGAVLPPSSASVSGDIYGIALRSNRHSIYEGALQGFDGTRGSWPGCDVTVIPGGFPKVALADSPGAASAGGIPYVVKSGLDAGKFRANDGGTFGTWTGVISAFNGTDAVGIDFNGYVISVATGASNAATATLLQAKIAVDPIIGPRFTATVDTATVTLVALDKTTTWTLAEYSPATTACTVTNTVAQVAPTAIVCPNSKWGKGHASTATEGYLEFNV